MRFADGISSKAYFGLVRFVLEYGIRAFGMESGGTLRVQAEEELPGADTRRFAGGSYNSAEHVLNFNPGLVYDAAALALILLHELRHACQYEKQMLVNATSGERRTLNILLGNNSLNSDRLYIPYRWQADGEQRSFLLRYIITTAPAPVLELEAAFELKPVEDAKWSAFGLAAAVRRGPFCTGADYHRLPWEVDASEQSRRVRDRMLRERRADFDRHRRQTEDRYGLTDPAMFRTRIPD